MLRIAHRGASGYAPENTLASFQKALDLSVDMIELDVYHVKDGALVVMHDRKVDRTTNGTGYVESKTLEELKQLVLEGKEKVPILTEVLDLVNKRVQVNIELKGERTASPVAQLIDQYVHEKGWSYDHFLVSSFNHTELALFKKLLPVVRIGALTSTIPLDYAKFAEDLGAYSAHLYIEFINKAFVEDAKKRGLKVFVYTANDKDDISALKSLGVDGLFGNYPDRI